MKLWFLLAAACWPATFTAPAVRPSVTVLPAFARYAAPHGGAAPLVPMALQSVTLAPVPLQIAAAPQLDFSVTAAAAAAAPNTPVEASRGLSGNSFDGPGVSPVVSVETPIAVEAPMAIEAPAPPSYLVVADPVDRAWLGRVVEAAQASPTARRVLRKVEQLAVKQGRPVIIRFGRLGLGGEYHYDWETVGIDSRSRQLGPVPDVPTLIHELQHVLQKPQGLPSGAFELELEAYLVDFKVSREMGFVPVPGSYDARAQTQFRMGLDGFISWLLNEYKDNTPLIGSTLARFKEGLVKERRLADRLLKRWTKELAAREAILDAMKSTGQKPEAIAAYAAEAVGAAAERLRLARTRLGWAQRDMALLEDPAGRARYRAFARKVLGKARRYQREYSRGAS